MLQLLQARHSNCCEEGLDVLETIAIILIVLWLLGMVSGYTLGNFIWVLLVIAVGTVPGATGERSPRRLRLRQILAQG